MTPQGQAPALTLPPLSLYIHVPWCIRKCPYCDFNSHQSKGELPEDEYVAALLSDFVQDLPYVQGRAIQSIFIGGGTPSLFSADAYDTLFNGLLRYASFTDDIEITLEANPGTAEMMKFADYRRAGINRLSIGIQSFDEQQLGHLGRIHNSAESRRAIDFARRAGFDNLNLDLMYGLKDQSCEQALADLHAGLSHAPEHLSWYQLTIEPNTEFYKRPPTLPPEDELINIQEAGLALLRDSGFQRYEISAFARQGHRSRHNLNYWRFGDYLGIGAGAHGKITLPGERRLLRTRKNRQPGHYLQGASTMQFTAGSDDIAQDDLALEYLLNVLRLQEGFTTGAFEGATGLGYGVIAKQIESLLGKSLLCMDNDRIRPTEKGLQFLNTVLEEFL